MKIGHETHDFTWNLKISETGGPLEEEIPNLEIESVSVSVSPFRYLKAQESHAPRTRVRFRGEMTIWYNLPIYFHEVFVTLNHSILFCLH